MAESTAPASALGAHGDLASLRRFAADLAAFAGSGGIGLALLLLLGGLVEGVGIVLLVPLLAVVVGGSAGEGWLAEATAWLLGFAPGEGRLERLLFLLALFALLLGLRAAVLFRRDVALARLEAGFIETQRLRTATLLAGTRWDALARLRHGRVTHVLGGDMQAAGLAAALLLQCLVALTLLTGQFAVALALSPLLAVLLALLLGAGALAMRPALRRARSIGAGLTASSEELVVGTSEFLGGLKLALSQNLERGFLDELARTLRRATDRRLDFARQRTGAQLALTAVAAAAAGTVALVGIGVIGLAGTTVIVFILIMARMNGPAAQIQNGAQMLFHSLPAYGQIRALQAELEEAQDAEQPPTDERPPPRGPIELAGVAYTHSGGGGVADLDLTLGEGELVGISGPSGAGKSTLADLLVGLYPPQRGAVRVGGRLLSGTVLRAWRDSVGYVAQDPFLFHDSIRRNLLWARPDAGEGDLREALALAGAEPLVRRLAGGLDAVVGERGTLLSGGERQRIALARALVRRPRLLVLDEATSAIDLAGEAEILERLATMPDRPTVVVIAHRPESLAWCDRVLELREGRLVGAPAAGSSSPRIRSIR